MCKSIYIAIETNQNNVKEILINECVINSKKFKFILPTINYRLYFCDFFVFDNNYDKILFHIDFNTITQTNTLIDKIFSQIYNFMAPKPYENLIEEDFKKYNSLSKKINCKEIYYPPVSNYINNLPIISELDYFLKFINYKFNENYSYFIIILNHNGEIIKKQLVHPL